MQFSSLLGSPGHRLEDLLLSAVEHFEFIYAKATATHREEYGRS
jgi:hypothetical protein